MPWPIIRNYRAGDWRTASMTSISVAAGVNLTLLPGVWPFAWTCRNWFASKRSSTYTSRKLENRSIARIRLPGRRDERFGPDWCAEECRVFCGVAGLAALGCGLGAGGAVLGAAAGVGRFRFSG